MNRGRIIAAGAVRRCTVRRTSSIPVVAGDVEPVGIVYRRMSVQRLVDFFRRFGRQMTFGNVGRDVVSLLSPSQGGLQRAGAEDE